MIFSVQRNDEKKKKKFRAIKYLFTGRYGELLATTKYENIVHCVFAVTLTRTISFLLMRYKMRQV